MYNRSVTNWVLLPINRLELSDEKGKKKRTIMCNGFADTGGF